MENEDEKFVVFRRLRFCAKRIPSMVSSGWEDSYMYLVLQYRDFFRLQNATNDTQVEHYLKFSEQSFFCVTFPMPIMNIHNNSNHNYYKDSQ